MNLGVIGSRSGIPEHVVHRYLDQLPPETVIVTGGWMAYRGYSCVEASPGVDRMAWRYAEKLGLVTVLCIGSVTRHENRAGLQRNPIIAGLSEHVVAFWDLKSRGTMDTLRWCQRYQRPVTVINPEGHGVDDWTRYVQAR